MNRQLEQNLKDEFPQIFDYLWEDTPETNLMYYGCRCEDGWYELIRILCKELMESSIGRQFKVIQVKEKMGGLRFYHEFGDGEQVDIIRAAERESFKTCEECGTVESVKTETVLD